MLVEQKRSIINVRQIQHHIADLKMELLVKIVNDGTLFSQKCTILDMTQVLSSRLTTINQCFS